MYLLLKAWTYIIITIVNYIWYTLTILTYNILHYKNFINF